MCDANRTTKGSIDAVWVPEADLVDRVKRHLSANAAAQQLLMPPVPPYHETHGEAFVAVAALQRACHSDTLRSLLATQNVGPYLAAALQRNRSIRSLDISSIRGHVQGILRVLETHPTLTHLSIHTATDEDLAALLRLLEHNPRIQNLDLRVAAIVQLAALYQAASRNLHSLSMIECGLTDDQPFGELISTSRTLRRLDISGNRFTDARHIAFALANTKTRLRILNMGLCRIRAQKMRDFNQCLARNFSLTSILWSSSSANVHAQMADALAVVRRNERIRLEMQAALVAFIHCTKAVFNKDLRKLICSAIMSLANEWDDRKTRLKAKN